MKTITLGSLALLIVLALDLSAQETASPEVSSAEKFGNTLNLGVGIGYYRYARRSMPVFHADFEFDVAKSLTLAPFITYYSYQNYYYWGNPHYPYKDYYYRQTVIPLGVKVSYYFDPLLEAGPKWDFYLAGSLGFAIRTIKWENGYYGETTVQNGSSGLYLDVHMGTEYHLNQKVGLFLDLSTGISTFGAGIHF